MTLTPSEFWTRLDQARAALNEPDAGAMLERLWAQTHTGDPETDAGRRRVLRLCAGEIGLDLPETPDAPAPPETPLSEPDSPAQGAIPGTISKTALPGVSVVTCAMNRSDNLIRALASWLPCPAIDEVVIIDWSSAIPVADRLAQEGIADPRIRVIRVEGEPRWILSYAFNLGFRAARHDRILKMDADILLDPDFFARTALPEQGFVAGNWRLAEADQGYVNGFFYAPRAALAAVGGFNEYIRSYGWDDDDLYTRLTEAGFTRHDVDPALIWHQPHDDSARTGLETGSEQAVSALEELRADTLFLIRRNRFLANVLPVWTDDSPHLPFDPGPGGALRRRGYEPSAVPDHVFEDAGYYALAEMTAWRLGDRARALPRDRLLALLDRPFADLTPLDVELALARPQNQVQPHAAPRGYLLIDLPRSAAPDQTESEALAALAALAPARGRAPILRTRSTERPAGLPDTIGFLPIWQEAGPAHPVDVQALCRGFDAPSPARLLLDPDTATALTLPSPDIARRRPRLFIDGQHGLGNRLRALASAASVARATGRELVVVWQADAHCDCALSDLFDYDGAVIAESFHRDAGPGSFDLFNYMEVEPGSLKGAPLALREGRDAYLRSAYVLAHPASDWARDNAFLHGLTPSEPVRDLVAGVRHPNAVSVHIRMSGGSAQQHLAYEHRANWTAEGQAQIDHWRGQSHHDRFAARLDALIAQGAADTIFLAADTAQAYAAFADRYGDRLAWLERALYDRSAEQLCYGLADAILLARAPRMLGSTWSSFSELAQRLAPEPQQVEMSGVDF